MGNPEVTLLFPVIFVIYYRAFHLTPFLMTKSKQFCNYSTWNAGWPWEQKFIVLFVSPPSTSLTSCQERTHYLRWSRFPHFPSWVSPKNKPFFAPEVGAEWLKVGFLKVDTRDILGLILFMSSGVVMVGYFEAWPLHIRCHQHPFSCDNQRYFKKLPNVPLRAKSPPVKDHWFKAIQASHLLAK